MYHSLARYCPDLCYWVLCFDDLASDVLNALALPGICPVNIREFEKENPHLKTIWSERTRFEYFFTCKHLLPKRVMERELAEGERVTYLDADMFFYSNPEQLFDEMGENSVMLVPHRFPDDRIAGEIHGRYNAGYISMRNDSRGRACMQWWADRCIEWCFEKVEEKRFADQKYLQYLETISEGVCAIQAPGGGLAPWNLARHRITWDGREVLVDEKPLIFFHFHGLTILKSHFVNTGLPSYGVALEPVVRRHIFRPYLNAVTAAERQLKRYVRVQGNPRHVKTRSWHDVYKLFRQRGLMWLH